MSVLRALNRSSPAFDKKIGALDFAKGATELTRIEKTLALVCSMATAIVLTLSSTGCCVPEISPGPATSRLNVQSAVFESIGSEKNVVYVTVSNPTAAQRIFGVRVQTNSRVWWGQPCFATVKAGETSRLRCVFPFIGPVTNDASIELRFYEPPSKAAYDPDRYFQDRVFHLADLELRKTADLENLPPSDVRGGQVRQAFQSFQELIRRRRYSEVWKSTFSQDYRANIGSLDDFQKAMSGDVPYFSTLWDRDVMLSMRPISVMSAGDPVVLLVTNGKGRWQIGFTRSRSGWRIDWISGFEPAILQLPDDIEIGTRLLARMHTFKSQHFDIYYYKNSTAEREVGCIAQTRERGYARIIQSIGLSGLPSDRKIMLFLFEDMKTKFLDTGTIGQGFANGEDAIGEVYNNRMRLDPYHEITHILMGPYGKPPAVFDEGIAVYMSERLGAPALRNLGGGNRTIYAQVRNLRQKGEWISLKELLSYTNIGSQGSRTGLAYAEAGAFVKFLIETFGKDKFLDAYKKLENPEDPGICRQNQEELERIYGCSLQKLEGDWERAFLSNSR